MLKQIPRRIWIISGVVLTIVLYGIIFLFPKQVEFAYVGKTCASQLLLFPDVQQQSDDGTLKATLEGGASLGSWRIFSTSVCFSPADNFKAGATSFAISPWRGPIFAKQFRVNIPEPPRLANVAEFTKRVSAARPIEMNLTAADVIHTYMLKVADKTSECQRENEATTLLCEVAPLSLEHGKEYSFAMYRDIPGLAQDEQEVALFKATTLLPVNIASASVKDSQTVYDTISKIEFEADKPLDAAELTVVRKEGETEAPIRANVAVSGAKGVITFDEPLARKATYVLRISRLDGADGSSLASPYIVTFGTSGGPKVASSSVGSNSLAQNQTIILTFDQTVDSSVDVASFIRVSGAQFTLAKRSDTEVSVTLRGASLCSAVTITVDKGIKSGSNGEVSDEPWTQQSRVICGTSAAIGYSVQGRPIIAYYFGTGASTILFTGGMHGSEPSGYSTMQAWANYLMAYGDQIPAGKRVVVVPNTNPDGIAAGSRNSSTNVNIGRNFPTTNWKADIETSSGILQNGGGTSPGSEPESAALMALTRQLRPRLEVSYHAQGSLVGANKYGDSVAIGNTYASMVGYGTMFYDAEAVMGYPMTGEYEDWMGEEMGIPAILIELPTPSGNYLNSQLPALKKMLAV